VAVKINGAGSSRVRSWWLTCCRRSIWSC